MNPQDKILWSRLDGEMPPDEAERFDRALTAEDCGRLGAELGLERRLGEMLARPAPGADEAWRAALERVSAHKQAGSVPVRRRRMAWAVLPVALAATLLVMLSVGHDHSAAQQPWYLSVGAHGTVKQTTPSQAQAVAATARNLLRDRDMHMAFDPKNSLESANASYRLVSVRGEQQAGEPVVEMVFLCDGKPAKVIITNASGNAAHEIGRAADRGAALASRSVGDWLVTAVGVQAPDELLSLIEEAQPESQDNASIHAGEAAPVETPTPDTAVTAPETVPETAVVAPDTAVAAPQPEPEAAQAAPETAPAPDSATQQETAPPTEKPDPTKTMV